MQNIPLRVLPKSIEDANGWIPSGLIQFFDANKIHEHKESYENTICKTKDEADQIFIERAKERYQSLN